MVTKIDKLDTVQDSELELQKRIRTDIQNIF